jgi:DUF1680 family protein
MNLKRTFLLTFWVTATLPAQVVSVLDRPPVDQRHAYYPGNRPPLLPSPFARLPIGAIRPEGWLRKQLEVQAGGFSRHLTEISAFCMKEGNAWLSKDQRGHGEWEEVPYWLKGFADLGYVLDDRRLKAEAQEWIEAVLASQRADGWFGPLDNLASPRNRTGMPGEKVEGRPDLWPNALMMSVLRSNYEHTQDARILQHLLRYCDWLLALPEKDYLIHWVDKRRGVEHLKNFLWLYNVTGERRLLDLAPKAHRRTSDWTSGISRYHCVDVAQCFYEPGLYSTLSGDRRHLEAAERNYRTVYDEFGQVPGGMFGGDEMARPGYTGPRQGIETCAMVEMMNACEMMFTLVDGDIRWADRCEDVAFNSYPAALTADMKALRYLTAPNMPVSDRAPKNPDIANGGAMFIMNPHAHRCCQHNHAHGWPYFAEHLWLATADNGLCAMLYAASTVSARVGDGRTVTLRQTTRYPFSDMIEFVVSAPGKIRFPLYLRVPGWCENASVTVNGRRSEAAARPGKYLRLEREWKSGDVVTLQLPMRVAVRTWTKNDGCVSVDRGPLTYSLKIEERYVRTDGRDTIRQSKFLSEKANFKDWPAFEIFPESAWNYGLVLSGSIEFAERPWPTDDQPWTHAGAPVMLTASARRIPGWTLQQNNLIGPMPVSPVKSEEPSERITLLPMGACRLRLSAFPAVGSGPDARPYAAEGGGEGVASKLSYKTADGMQVLVSFKNPRESVAALFDGVTAPTSDDRSIPRLTFWPHKGTAETITIEFGRERAVRGLEVLWFDDKSGYRVPAAAQLEYFTDDEWTPVRPAAQVPVAPNRMNRLDITPVSTTAVRLKIQLQPKLSGGLLELRVL